MRSDLAGQLMTLSALNKLGLKFRAAEYSLFENVFEALYRRAPLSGKERLIDHCNQCNELILIFSVHQILYVFRAWAVNFMPGLRFDWQERFPLGFGSA